MPFISDTQIATLQNEVVRKDETISRLRRENKESSVVENAMRTLEVVGGAGVVGFMRGKFEKPDGSWGLPGFEQVDMELLIGLGLASVAFMPKWFGKYADDFGNVGAGVLAHYTGQIGRKFAKTGTFSSIAGSDVGMMPSYVGALPPFVGDARAEELARALAQSAAA